MIDLIVIVWLWFFGCLAIGALANSAGNFKMGAFCFVVILWPITWPVALIHAGLERWVKGSAQ